MSYQALVTTLSNVRKAENADHLYLADVFGEGVVVGPDMKDGDKVVYFPTDGKIERWFGDKFTLFRKNTDGTVQGGYLEDNGHVRAIKLRGHQSSGIVIPYDHIKSVFVNVNWKVGDTVTEISGREFCSKYIPKQKVANNTPKTSYKGRKAEGIVYPEFAMHADTQQLAYNMDVFRPGDLINMSLKMHGTSQRSMKTYAQLPRGFFRKLFHMKAKTVPAYVLGTRRCVVHENSQGYYGNDQFRMQHHKKIEPFVQDGMEVFYEVVGWYGDDPRATIMPIGDNRKLNDKAFVKTFGPESIFSYGCKPGQSEMYVYRITVNDGAREYTPAEITDWCKKAGVHQVPQIENFIFTTKEDLQERINKYFEDLADPIGKTHVKEGVVIRIVNGLGFKAYKSKTYEFKVLEGLIKETATEADMEEAQEDVS